MRAGRTKARGNDLARYLDGSAVAIEPELDDVVAIGWSRRPPITTENYLRTGASQRRIKSRARIHN